MVMKRALFIFSLTFFCSSFGVWAQQMNVSVSKETQKSSQSEITATTPFVCGESKVADYDGNCEDMWFRARMKKINDVLLMRTEESNNF